MKGLQIWAYSYCRSVMAFYGELAEAFGVPYRVVCERIENGRFSLGWSRDEFSGMNIVQAGSDINARLDQLNEHKDWAQWFSTYQNSKINIRLIKAATDFGASIGMGSEAPSNGIRPSLKRWIKESSFFRRAVRRQVRYAVESADFILNYSGDGSDGLSSIGWPCEKIIPFGYYPPPLEGLKARARTTEDWKKFEILVTGALDWRRGHDTIIEGLKILAKWGCRPHVVITQTGELLDTLKAEAERSGLNVSFVGFADYQNLLHYYQSCSVFVAAGRCEPWGIRINDAINAGAPVIVSSGMGGAKLVRDYGCGLTFMGGDVLDFAWHLKALIDDKELYLKIARRVIKTIPAISPRSKAQEIVDVIRQRYPSWG